jgi:hypothetical protein
MNLSRASIIAFTLCIAGKSPFAAADDHAKPAALIPTTGAVTVTIQAAPNGQVFLNGASGVLKFAPDPEANIPPEQAVVIDLHRPWVDGARWDNNTAPVVYGVDETVAEPRFTLADPNANCLWVYRLALPIEVKKYPMLSMKYRALNASKAAAYVLRMVFSNGDAKSRADAWNGADLIADGQEHELDEDLRTVNNGNPDVFNFGIGLKTDVAAATFDLVELKFSAASDSPNEKPKDDLPVRMRVVDGDGHPLSDAKVIIDAERANFARVGQTDKSGYVSITPLLNESAHHMVRAEKAGYLTVENVDTSSESGQALDIRTVPAVSYGGIAKTDNGAVAAGARINITLKSKVQDLLATRVEANVVTDEKGQWATLPLPADAEQLNVGLHQRDASGKVTETTIEAGKFQLSKPEVVLAAVTAAVVEKGTTDPTNATTNASTTEPVASATPQAAKVNPVTAIIQKVDESTTAVGLTGIDHDQLQIIQHPEPGKDEAGTIPLMDVTDVMFKKAGGYNSAATSSTATTRPIDRLANCRVVMAGEDRLNGDIVAWTQKHVTIRPNIAPKVTIDLAANQLQEIWCGTPDQVKKAQDLKEKTTTQDVLFAAKDADVVAVHGIATGIVGDSLHFLYNDEDRKIALNRVVGLILAKPDDSAAQDESFHETVQLVTDEQISGHVTGFDGKQLTLAVLGDAQEVQLPLDEVAKISTRNGRVVFLSDMKPTKVEQMPFFDRLMPYRMDQSLSGKPIVLLDGSYPKGISVHSRCVLTFNLDGRFDEFCTKVGFALPEGKIGQAALRVIGDGKTLYENPDAHGDQMPADLKLKVGGVHELILEVDYGKNDDTGDRVTWANARLIRATVGK